MTRHVSREVIAKTAVIVRFGRGWASTVFRVARGRHLSLSARVCVLVAAVLGISSGAVAMGAEVAYTIDTFAGSGVRGSRDGALDEAEFYGPGSIALAPDGTMYVADDPNGVRIVRDGVVSTLPLPWQMHYASSVALRGDVLYIAVAIEDPRLPPGLGLRPTIVSYDLQRGVAHDLLAGKCLGHTGPAYPNCGARPFDVAVMDDAILSGTFFGNQVYALYPDGTQFLYAGRIQENNNVLGVGLNEGGAPQGARFDTVVSIDVDAAGNLYLSDYGHCLVRQVDRKGIIRTVAGGKGSTEEWGDPEPCGFSGDGGPALQAALGDHTTFRVGRDRDLFIAHRRKIRYVDSKGRISTIAGRDDSVCDAEGGCCAGDGGPALAADLSRPIMGAVGQDGAVYFLEPDGCPRVRVLRPVR